MASNKYKRIGQNSPSHWQCLICSTEHRQWAAFERSSPNATGQAKQRHRHHDMGIHNGKKVKSQVRSEFPLVVVSFSIQHDFRLRAVAAIFADQKMGFIADDSIAPVAAEEVKLIAQVGMAAARAENRPVLKAYQILLMEEIPIENCHPAWNRIEYEEETLIKPALFSAPAPAADRNHIGSAVSEPILNTGRGRVRCSRRQQKRPA